MEAKSIVCATLSLQMPSGQVDTCVKRIWDRG